MHFKLFNGGFVLTAPCTMPPWIYRKRLLTKTMLVMKLTILLLLTGTLYATAAGYGQPVTISKKDATLDQVFREIRKQSDFTFVYNDKLLAGANRLSINVKQMPVEQVLELCFKDQPFTYQVIDKIIIVKQKESTINNHEAAPLPPIDISGQVINDKGEPVEGVNVMVKGTVKGTTTNEKGIFTLRDVDENASLVFSSIGYEAQTVAVNKRTHIPVTLHVAVQSIEQAVVVGFGTQKRVNLTGSVAAITAEDIASRPITSVSTALQGLLPGLTAVGQSGMPGSSGALLRVRGLTTFNNSEPFVLVDGVPQDLNNINPEDILSVSVLKDAASASIYGSRAANGVILITTKTGKFNQQPVVAYNGYYGMQSPTKLPKMLGSPEYMQMLNEALKNVSLPPTFTDAQIETAKNGSDPNYFSNTNWFKEIYKDYAPQQNHSVSITGGAAGLNYYASYGYLDQDGLAAGNQFKTQRNNARLRLTAAKLLDLLDVDVNLGYIDRVVNQSSAATSQNGGVFYTGLTMSPLNPVYFTNGKWGYGGGSSNPIAIATDGGFDKGKVQQFTGNIAGTLHLMKNLNVRVQYGLDMYNQQRNIYTRRIDYFYPETGIIWYTSNPNNTLDARQYSNRLQTFLAQVNYSLNIGDHHVKTFAGTQLEWARNDYWRATELNFLSDDVPVFNLGTGLERAFGDASQYALRGYYARVNYDFNEKYFLELNGRYDGSSKYAQDARYGFFPSASVGWRFTKEKFFANSSALQWLNEGKLRASYGLLGNQYNADATGYGEMYPYIPVINAVSTMPIGNVLTQGYAQTVLSNQILQWEKVKMLNIGVDLAFFNNRLTFTGEWFERTTKGIQLKVAQPGVVGVSVPDQNAGSVSNKGWELSLGWNDRAGELRYGFTAQLSDVRNKVLDLGGVATSFTNNIRMVGYPINAYYGYVTAGIAQQSDFTKDGSGNWVPNFPIFVADAGKVAPGDLKFVDQNGDGFISADKDRKVIGDPFPHYTWSFRGEASWKNIDFAFFLQGVGKAGGYISGPAIHPFYADAAFPQEAHRDYWTPENTNAWYPRLLYKDTRNTTRQLASYWLQDASYLRVKNIQVGYTVPAKLLNRWRFNKLRAYISGDNLFTKTNFFSSYDPETIVPEESSGDKISNGGFYPQIRTIVFGIQVTLK
jgi:TonB-linked SusC/RagA family outer membrane protein